MEDNEIIKALECCIIDKNCSKCPHYNNGKIATRECLEKSIEGAIDLINRLQAENERLKEVNDGFTCIGKFYSEIKAEAYKEFAELSQNRCIEQQGCLYSSDIGAIYNELVGE